MEMEEKDVVDREARKSVEQCADHGVALEAHMPLQPAVGSRGSAGEFEDQQRSDQIRDDLVRKGDRQPEKRAAHQIEAVARQGVGTEVGEVVPAELTGAYMGMDQLIEGDLLHIEVAVIIENAAVIGDKRRDQHDRQRQRRHKGQPQIMPAANAVRKKSVCHFIAPKPPQKLFL